MTLVLYDVVYGLQKLRPSKWLAENMRFRAGSLFCYIFLRILKGSYKQDICIGGYSLNLLKGLKTVHSRHPYIKNHNTELFVLPTCFFKRIHACPSAIANYYPKPTFF